VSSLWYFTAVYDSPNDNLRYQLWAKLSNLNATFNKPWLLAGDFNNKISMREREGCSLQLERRCSHFNNWIQNNRFVDLGFSGRLFIWAREKTKETRK